MATCLNGVFAGRHRYHGIVVHADCVGVYCVSGFCRCDSLVKGQRRLMLRVPQTEDKKHRFEGKTFIVMC